MTPSSPLRQPDAVKFACPKCGCEWLAETQAGRLDWKPPTCQFMHAPVEMEQVYLGADAYHKGAA